MGYINRVVSRYSLEEDFSKTVANFLNNASNKIVWNEDDATISSQMAAATGNFPNLSFNILQDFLLRYRFAPGGSNARTEVSFIVQHEDFNKAFINSSQSFTGVSNTFINTMADRTLRFKIITNNNCIFISINNNLNMFFIKTNDFIGVSVAISEALSPLTSSFKLKIKKTGEDEWKSYNQINRLQYLYNQDDTQELEIIRNKVFLEPGTPAQKGIVINNIFDCSYFNSPGSIINLNQQKYYVLDEYTLMKIEQEGR